MKLKKLLTLVMVAALTTTASSAFAMDKRVLAGNDRFETAVNVSKYGFKTSKNIVLVNGRSLCDALSATPFAKAKNAPILLSEINNLTEPTKDEIRRLKAENVYVIGGRGVISENVVNELKNLGLKVYRIYGNDRYETSLSVAKELDMISDVEEIAVANGHTGLTDALSVASPAAAHNIPIILSRKDSLGKAREWIDKEHIRKSYIIGGQGVISKSLETSLPNYKRLFGSDRWETNAAVLNEFFSESEISNIYLAKDGILNSDELVDALSAGPAAAKDSAPIMLIGNKLSSGQQDYLDKRKSVKFTEVGYGINQNTVEDVYHSLNFKSTDEGKVVFVDYINSKQIQIHFSSPIQENTVLYNGKLIKENIEIKSEEYSPEGKISISDMFYGSFDKEGKTLTLTRDLNNDKVFSGDYTIRVSDRVKTSKGRNVEPYIEKITVKDVIHPQVKYINYDNISGNLTISFTEPIKEFPALTVDGKLIQEGSDAYMSSTRDLLTISYRRLKEMNLIGRYVNVSVQNSTDYRGLSLIKASKKIHIGKSSEDTKVEDIRLINGRTIEILFATPIKENSAVYNGHLLKNNIKISSNAKGSASIDNSDAFDAYVEPDGIGLLITRPLTDNQNLQKIFNGEYTIDVTSNVLTDDELPIKPCIKTLTLKDETKPEIKAIDYDEIKGNLVIKFSEELKELPKITIGKEEFQSEDLIFPHSRDNVVIKYDTLKNKKLVSDGMEKDKAYDIKISNVKDITGNAMEDYNSKITIKPLRQVFRAVKVENVQSRNKYDTVIVVTFNKDVEIPKDSSFELPGTTGKPKIKYRIENNVEQRNCIELTYGEGTINSGLVAGDEDKLLKSTLRVENVKAKDGSICKTTEWNDIIIKDNTSAKLISRVYNGQDRKLKLEFNEPMDFTAIENDKSKTSLLFRLSSNIVYRQNNSINKKELGNQNLSEIEKIEYEDEYGNAVDVDGKLLGAGKYDSGRKPNTIIITFKEDKTGKLNELMAGTNLRLLVNNPGDGNYLKDANGTPVKSENKAMELRRNDLIVGYIQSDYNKYDISAKNKIRVWLSEEVNPNDLGRDNISIKYNGNVIDSSRLDLSVDPQCKNVLIINIKKNTIDLSSASGDINSSSVNISDIQLRNFISKTDKILENYSAGTDGFELKNAKLYDDIVTELLEGRYYYKVVKEGSEDKAKDAIEATLELKFDEPVKPETIEKGLFNSIIFINNKNTIFSGDQGKYPEIIGGVETSDNNKIIRFKFKKENIEKLHKFIIDGGSINLVTKEDSRVKDPISGEYNHILDGRGKVLETDNKIQLVTNEIHDDISPVKPLASKEEKKVPPVKEPGDH